MAAQVGSDILLKIDNGSGSYQTIAGLRTKSFKLGQEQVDTTNSDSVNKFREMLGGAGIKSLSVSASGVFLDAVADATLLAVYTGQIANRNFQLTLPSFQQITGPFMVADLEYTGEHNGEMTFNVTLESSGALTFLAI